MIAEANVLASVAVPVVQSVLVDQNVHAAVAANNIGGRNVKDRSSQH